MALRYISPAGGQEGWCDCSGLGGKATKSWAWKGRGWMFSLKRLVSLLRRQRRISLGRHVLHKWDGLKIVNDDNYANISERTLWKSPHPSLRTRKKARSPESWKGKARDLETILSNYLNDKPKQLRYVGIDLLSWWQAITLRRAFSRRGKLLHNSYLFQRRSSRASAWLSSYRA